MTIHQRSGRVSPTPGQQPAHRDSPAEPSTQETEKGSFADHLETAKKEKEGLQLSAHAKRRLAQRNISLDASEREDLTEAVQQLDEKGAQEAAVLRDDAAFVVNVPNRTVVTALDHNEMNRRVFTQIDSAMKL